jgi:NAD+ synthetase
MQVHNPQNDTALRPELTRTLDQLRRQRNFDTDRLIDRKTELLNSYMREHGLQACVIALSGGLDSAVSLALTAHAAQKPDSPIRRIVPLLLPVLSEDGATNQDEACERGREICANLGLRPAVADLTAAHASLRAAVDIGVGITGQPWAVGQLVAYARTPAIYYTTSLLTQEGLPAIVVGTTNRDEGSYLGYVGKASDGMVDVQLIADLHKSEVFKVAAAMNLPESVLNAVPTGDMYDGRTDEEVFGAPYDFVELFLLWRCTEVAARAEIRGRWSAEACAQFDELSQRLGKLHAYNAHKYLVGSPAVHLNVYESAVPGGWKEMP